MSCLRYNLFTEVIVKCIVSYLYACRPVASQSTDEGGQSPGVRDMLGALMYLLIFFSVGTLHTKFSLAGKFGFYLIAGFDSAVVLVLLVHIL